MDTSYYVDTYYGYNAANTSGIVGGAFVFSIIVCIIAIIISIFTLICLWKVFKKLGKPGWASLVPIYNIYVMCQIAGKEWWYILLFFVPIANIYAMFVLYDGISKKFGKTTGFTIGMMFLPFVFFAILAFSKNEPAVSDSESTNDVNVNGAQAGVSYTQNPNTYQGMGINNNYGTSNASNINNDALEKTQINIGQNYQSQNFNTNFAGAQNNYQTQNNAPYNNAFNQPQSMMQGANDFSTMVGNQANTAVNQNASYGANLVNNVQEVNVLNNANQAIESSVINSGDQALNQNTNPINNNYQETSQPSLEKQNSDDLSAGYVAPSFDEPKIVNPSNDLQDLNADVINNGVEKLDLVNEELNQENVAQRQPLGPVQNLNEEVNADGYKAPSFDEPKENISQPNMSFQATQPVMPTSDNLGQGLNDLNQNKNYDNNTNSVQQNQNNGASNVRTSLWSNHNQNNQQ